MSDTFLQNCKKIGIMGGTFNPIHNGHLSLADAAITQYQLDEIWFMPSGLPAHKSNSELLPAKDRLTMVELAVRDTMKFRASSFEIDREGFTYTAETMPALAKEYPNHTFYFIIGGDSLMKFHRWVKPEVISEYVTLLAAGRNGYSMEELLHQKEYLNCKFGTKVLFVDMPEINISSSNIRSDCKKECYVNVEQAVPGEVLEYIKANRLYV